MTRPDCHRRVLEEIEDALFRQEPLDEMRADEADTPRHERKISHSAIVTSPASGAASPRGALRFGERRDTVTEPP